MSKKVNVSESIFDFAANVTGLEIGVEYTDELRNSVKEWNAAQIGSDLSKKYDKITVKTLDGRVTGLTKGSAYAELPSDIVKTVDEFFSKAGTEALSRKKIHGLLADINKALPADQKIRLNKEVECGLADCLTSRKLVGNKFTRNLRDICRVIVRTYYAVLNGKELSVVYKGL